MTQLALTLPEARARRDAGMQRALDHAEDDAPGWADTAYAFLLVFASNNPLFVSEDVSDAARATARFPQPPTNRAWGPVYRRAAKAGVIELHGTGRGRRRHASLCPRWRSLIYRGAA